MRYDEVGKKYKNLSIETASPGKLILMLYDGALKSLDKAKKGFEIENKAKSLEVINNSVMHAHEIIHELRAALDMEVEGDLPMTMMRLYDYMMDLLMDANIKKEIEPIVEVEKHLKGIRDAWAEMLSKVDGDNDGDNKISTTSISCKA